MNRDAVIVPDADSSGDAGMSETRATRNMPLLALLATLLVTLGIYLPVLHYSFAPVDDASNILTNPYLANPAAQNLGYFFAHPYYFVYMPLTFCFWAICARIAPLSAPQEMPLVHAGTFLNPVVFHAASLLLQLANTALVFAILRRFRFLPWACATGALLFSLHPLQVESVAWVTGANNLTAGFFGLLTIYLYVRALPADPRQSATKAAKPLFLGLATVAFVCALLSKPTAAVLPLSIAAIELVVYRRPLRRWLPLLSGWCLLSAVCAFVAHAATADSSGSVWSPLWGRPFVAGDALAFYLIRLTVPLISLNYARPPQAILHQWWGYVDWLLPALLFGTLWFWPPRLPRKDKTADSSVGGPSWPRAAVLLFVCSLVSTIGLVPFYSQWNSTVADRYLYSAMLGPAVLVAYWLSSPAVPVNVRLVAAAVAVIALGSLSALQLPVWRTPFSFVEYTVTAEPDSPFVHALAGNVLFYRGDFEHALGEFEMAQKMLGTETLINNRMIVNTLTQMRRYDEALKPMVNIVLATPADKTAWLQLWSLLPHLHDTARLETIMHQRLDRNPRDGRASFTLGAILLYRGSPDEALPYLSFAVQSSPEFSGMQYDFGVMLEGMNRLPEAESQYERALSGDPHNKQAANALALLRSRLGH